MTDAARRYAARRYAARRYAAGDYGSGLDRRDMILRF
jgi:hypothetical protein